MLTNIKFNKIVSNKYLFNIYYPFSTKDQTLFIDDSVEFKPIKILPYGQEEKKSRTVIKNEIISPRYKRLSDNHDWGKVWPNARNFHPLTVPLPVHMSYVSDDKSDPPISKFNNPELLKIPNFLHLTPPVVKKHCDALKRFCTKWPSALKTDEDCDKHFPVNILTKDFVFSGPSIRWPKARIVEMSLKLDSLDLDQHASDKMKKLLHDKYNSETNTLTIRAESCPLRKQNYDYAQYLLTALYFESWKTEIWESEKEYSDWERYYWDKSKSRSALLDYFKRLNITDEKEILEKQTTKNYANSVINLYEKETPETIDKYKESVVSILF